DPSRYGIAGLISATHRNHQNLWDATANDGEKLESRHLRHVQVGNDELRHLALHLQQRIEAILRAADFVSFSGQQHRHCGTNASIVIYNQNSIFGSGGHWRAPQPHLHSSCGKESLSLAAVKNLLHLEQFTKVILSTRFFTSRAEQHSIASCESAWNRCNQ